MTNSRKSIRAGSRNRAMSKVSSRLRGAPDTRFNFRMSGMTGSCCMWRLLFFRLRDALAGARHCTASSTQRSTPRSGSVDSATKPFFNYKRRWFFLTDHLRRLARLLHFLRNRILDRLCHLLRRHRAREKTLHGVVKDGTCGRGQELIIVQLEVVRGSKGLLDLEHIGIRQALLGAFNHRDARSICRDNRLVIHAGQVFDKVNGFRFSILANCKAVATTDHVRPFTSTPLDSREAEQTKILADTLLFRTAGGLCGGSPLSRELHSSLAITEGCLHIIVDRAEETFLEGLEGNQFLELCARLDKARIGKGTRPSHGSFKFCLSADASGQIVPEVHARPFVSLTDGDGSNTIFFQFLHIFEELGPSCGGSSDASLFEERFVVPETNHAHIPRHTVVLALVTIDTQSTGRKAIAPCRIGIQVCGDVLQQSGFDLLIERTAAPALDNVRGIARLHHGGEFGLEGFILQHC